MQVVAVNLRPFIAAVFVVTVRLFDVSSRLSPNGGRAEVVREDRDGTITEVVETEM
jgi:hypothetical protein